MSKSECQIGLRECAYEKVDRGEERPRKLWVVETGGHSEINNLHEMVFISGLLRKTRAAESLNSEQGAVA